MKRMVQNTWHANARAFGDIFKAGMGQQLLPLLLRSESLLTVKKNSGASKGHFQRVLIIRLTLLSKELLCDHYSGRSSQIFYTRTLHLVKGVIFRARPAS